MNAARALGLLVSVASLAFLGVAAARLDVAAVGSALTPGLALAGMGVLAGYFLQLLAACAGWKLLLDFVGAKRTRFAAVLPVFLQSNVGKYVPGSVAELAARNLIGAQSGLDRGAILKSSVIEAALSVGACLLLLGATALVSGVTLPGLDAKRLLAAAVGITGALGIFLAVGGAISPRFRLFARGQAAELVSPRFLATAARFGAITLMLVFSSAFFFSALLASATAAPWGRAQWLGAIEGFLVAYLGGYVAFGVPGGLGVRESLLLVLLGGRFGSEPVLIAAAAHRVLCVAGDALGFLAGKAIAAGRGRR